MNFEFATAQQILFGAGKLAELPQLIAGLGRKAALVVGSNPERAEPAVRALTAAGLPYTLFHISGEPTTDQIAEYSSKARADGCDFVVALGGGSVIDAGKAIAALLTNTAPLMSYLEVIGEGQPLTEEPAPCVAIPTTSGTGAEVTRNSVLASEEHGVKVSMRHPKMLPTIALVDPELTLSMSPEVTASTGLDAFTQLLEAFISKKANPLTDGICREGLKRVTRSMYEAYIHGNNLAARTDMAFASLCGGLALANAGLGAVHGFAGPIGGMFKAPHGMVCAALLPASAEINVDALTEREPNNPALAKIQEAARLVLRDEDGTIDEALDRLKAISMQMFVPGLEDFGIKPLDFPTIVAKAKNASSMKGNPIQLTDAELTTILDKSLYPPVDGNATLYM